MSFFHIPFLVDVGGWKSTEKIREESEPFLKSFFGGIILVYNPFTVYITL